MSDKIDPRLIAAGYVRQDDLKAKGGKVYRAAYLRGQPTRLGMRFGTAQAALAFSQRVRRRWIRLWFLDLSELAAARAEGAWTRFFDSAYDASKVVKPHANK